MEDVGALVLVFLQHSRLHRSSVAEHILQSRPVLSLRERDDGTQEVRCRRTKNRKSPTLDRQTSHDSAADCVSTFQDDDC